MLFALLRDASKATLQHQTSNSVLSTCLAFMPQFIEDPATTQDAVAFLVKLLDPGEQSTIILRSVTFRTLPRGIKPT